MISACQGFLSHGAHLVYLSLGSFTGAAGLSPSSMAGRLVVLSYSFLILVLISGYTASLATSLIVAASSSGYADLQEAMDAGEGVCLYNGTAPYEWFMNAFPSNRKQAVPVDGPGVNFLNPESAGCGVAISTELYYNFGANSEKFNPDCALGKVGSGYLEVFGCGWMTQVRRRVTGSWWCHLSCPPLRFVRWCVFPCSCGGASSRVRAPVRCAGSVVRSSSGGFLCVVVSESSSPALSLSAWERQVDYHDYCTSVLTDSFAYHLIELQMDGTIPALLAELNEAKMTHSAVCPSADAIESESSALAFIDMEGVFLLHLFAVFLALVVCIVYRLRDRFFPDPNAREVCASRAVSCSARGVVIGALCRVRRASRAVSCSAHGVVIGALCRVQRRASRAASCSARFARCSCGFS